MKKKIIKEREKIAQNDRQNGRKKECEDCRRKEERDGGKMEIWREN